jgi:hypothetical protein
LKPWQTHAGEHTFMLLCVHSLLLETWSPAISVGVAISMFGFHNEKIW